MLVTVPCALPYCSKGSVLNLMVTGLPTRTRPDSELSILAVTLSGALTGTRVIRVEPGCRTAPTEMAETPCTIESSGAVSTTSWSFSLAATSCCWAWARLLRPVASC